MRSPAVDIRTGGMEEMSRRKKIVVAVIAATLLGIAAVGCAETPGEESAEAAKRTFSGALEISRTNRQ
jgi:hypothetical protein